MLLYKVLRTGMCMLRLCQGMIMVYDHVRIACASLTWKALVLSLQQIWHRLFFHAFPWSSFVRDIPVVSFCSYERSTKVGCLRYIPLQHDRRKDTQVFCQMAPTTICWLVNQKWKRILISGAIQTWLGCSDSTFFQIVSHILPMKHTHFAGLQPLILWSKTHVILEIPTSCVFDPHISSIPILGLIPVCSLLVTYPLENIPYILTCWWKKSQDLQVKSPSSWDFAGKYIPLYSLLLIK